MSEGALLLSPLTAHWQYPAYADAMFLSPSEHVDAAAVLVFGS